jgi:hypothetical protein
MKVAFFNDMVDSSDFYYSDLFQFIGLDLDAGKVDIPLNFNRKTSPEKIEMSDDLYPIALDMLGDEYENLAECIGSHAKNWLLAKNKIATTL